MLHYVGLKYSFAHQIARQNFSFSCFIDSYNFLEKYLKRIYSDNGNVANWSIAYSFWTLANSFFCFCRTLKL